MRKSISRIVALAALAFVCDDAIATHTIYRPQDLSVFGKKELLPVLVWGNGGCANSSSGSRRPANGRNAWRLSPRTQAYGWYETSNGRRNAPDGRRRSTNDGRYAEYA